MSPFAITGIATAALTARIVSYSTGPTIGAGARAPVHGERADAGVLGDPRDGERIAVLADRRRCGS